MTYRNARPILAICALMVLHATSGLPGETRTLTGGSSIPLKYSKLTPVYFADVRIDDGFWSPRIETTQKKTIPDLLELAETQGKLDNFAIVAGKKSGKIRLHNCPDSDVYKLLEAASYTLAWRNDPALEKQTDEIIGVIAAAQADDGYLNTQYLLPFGHPASPERDHRHVRRYGYGPERQWKAAVSEWPKGYGQLYCAGHLLEAASAHYRATGKRSFLSVACKLADNIDRTFRGNGSLDYADHPQVEIGLFKLYEVTGEERYLRLADHITHNSKFHRPPDIGGGSSALPINEQRQAFGHCVRTMYIYSGATDVVRAVGHDETRTALESLWESVVGRKMYVHGGIGNGTPHEQHGLDYDLPNGRAYCECCASIAMGQWNHRLNLLSGDARYADVMELEAYNSALSGITLDGTKYFYCNKLAVGEKHQRRRRYLFCCPSKLPGFVSGISRWVYARDPRGIYVNLYVSSTADIALGAETVIVRQETDYPWDGKIALAIQAPRDVEFDLCLRIPGWASGRPVPTHLYRFADKGGGNLTLTVNGRPVDYKLTNGYARIQRRWKSGDKVELNLPMPVRRVHAHPKVKADVGRAALMRGPLVYCLEAVDNGGSVRDLILPPDSEITTEYRADLLGGVVVLRGKALTFDGKSVNFTAIPYYAWDNREAGEMLIWIAERSNALTK